MNLCEAGKVRKFFSSKILALSLLSVLLLLFNGCVPSDPVQFRSIKDVVLDTDANGQPMVKGEAVFYNPNNLRMKLKEIKMEVLVEGKKAADVDQKPDLIIPPLSEFSVAVEAHLSLQDLGLLDTVLSFFGGKKYEVQYIGYVRVRVHGVTVKVPIKFTDHMQLNK